MSSPLCCCLFLGDPVPHMVRVFLTLGNFFRVCSRVSTYTTGDSQATASQESGQLSAISGTAEEDQVGKLCVNPWGERRDFYSHIIDLWTLVFERRRVKPLHLHLAHWSRSWSRLRGRARGGVRDKQSWCWLRLDEDRRSDDRPLEVYRFRPKRPHDASL